MKNLTNTFAVAVALYASSAESQTFTTLVQFSGSGGAAIGASPFGSLTLSSTTLYGMTYGGGTNHFGNVFSVGTDGTNYRNLLSFSGTGGSASGQSPRGNLTLSGTALYGMTYGGGANGYGNVFSVGANGTNFRNLLSFTGSSGAATGGNPWGSLTLNGTTLYGMTAGGGANNFGNIFSVGADGTNFRNLLSFTGSSGAAIGNTPQGNLTPSGTTLYGMTAGGGANHFGNIFRIGADGTNYQDLVSFTGFSGSAAGVDPQGSLTIGGTTLYGMTFENGIGNVLSVGMDGVNFQNLVTFTGSSGTAIGGGPWGSLTLSGTTLYGTTRWGGTNGYGSVFSVGIDGSGYRSLYSFTLGADGGNPFGDLILSGGTLFGMTNDGGTSFGQNGNGTIFALTLPTPTPEPGTLALLAVGTAGLAGYGFRRRRHTCRVLDAHSLSLKARCS